MTAGPAEPDIAPVPDVFGHFTAGRHFGASAAGSSPRR